MVMNSSRFEENYMAAKYVKKPVVIEAMEWTGDEDAVRDFMGVLFLILDHNERLRIETLEGPMWANLGDYIICGVKGEFYPCKPDVFAMTYDRVEGE